MSASESSFGSEPNAFDEELSSGWDTSSPSVSFDAEGQEDTDVEIIGEEAISVPTHGVGKGLMTGQPFPIAAVYKDGTHVGPFGDQPVASTSGRGEGTAGPSRPRVTIVHRGPPRVPVGIPQRALFGVDYLEPNKLTERELQRIRAEYHIPDSVKMRIPSPTESLSDPGDGEVAFFTDMMVQGVRLPLQPAVQKILAQIGYAPGQYNPNFWVALMGVITAFGIAGEGEPSYEQFSHLYSVTKSKSADHGGWVQANCLKASERGHFISSVPTSQKSWRNRRVLLSGDWESPSGVRPLFPVPTTFQTAGRVPSCRSVGSLAFPLSYTDYYCFWTGKLKQPTPTQGEIRQIDRVRLKVPAAERVYPRFLFTDNLIRARLVDPAESEYICFYVLYVFLSFVHTD